MKNPSIYLAALVCAVCLVSCTDSGCGMSSVDRPDTSVRNVNYVSGRNPLVTRSFIKLPVGSVRPEGWVRCYLELQRDGLTGHLGEISKWLDKEDNAWLVPGGSMGWEEVPYWLKGYGNMAYILGDEDMIAETKMWIEGALSSRRDDGFFGPVNVRNGKPELWSQMIMLWCLQSYYEYSGDERVIDLMTGFFRWELSLPDEIFLEDYWENSRGGDNLLSVLWLYDRTGEEFLLELAEKLHRNTADWTQPTSLPNMVNSVDFANFFNAGTYNFNGTYEYSEEKIQALRDYISTGAGNPWAELTPGQSMVAAFENTANGLGNTNYFDLHYKDAAFKQNHNVSISGGGEKAQYYISGGMYKEEGLLRYADIDYRRFNFNANITSKVTDWLKLKVNTKYMNSNSDTPFGTGALSETFYHNLARFRPTVSVVDPNGYYTELSMIPYLQSGTFTNTQNNNLTMTGGLELEPIKNWRIFFDYTYRYNTRDYEAKKVLPEIPNADDSGTNTGTRTEIYDGGAVSGYTRSNRNNQYQSLNLYTNYMMTLNDKHNFTFLLGYQEEYYKYKLLSASVTDLQYPSNPSLEMADGDVTLGDTRYGWATRGYFARINYDYMGRYLVELNGRYDGSSRFSKGNRWGFFPSVSLGWRISEESFMEKTRNWLSNLKLRVSWGLLGNQAGADYYTFASSMNPTGIGNWYFNGVRSGYYTPGAVVDSNTTWEKVDHKNIGIDFGFFNNALTGTFDIFQRDTRDMLGPSVDLADFFGAAAPETNNAEMRNRGWELTLQWRGKIGKDIDYSIGGSVSDATAEVTAYDGGYTDPANNWYKGKKVGEIWGYRASGLIQDRAEADAYNSAYDLSYLSTREWTPGDVKYIDLNGDEKIDNGDNVVGRMGDMTIIGNTTPRYQYTINGSISWKGLSLSLMFQGVGKRDWCPETGTAYFWGAGAKAQVTVFEEHMDYWREDNKGAYYPKPYIGGAGAVASYRAKTSQKADRYVQNAAYCRLKNLTISYDLPEKWISKAHLTKAQVFFSGENLLTFTKLKIFDPEGLFTTNLAGSDAGKNYPMTRVFSVGVILNM